VLVPPFFVLVVTRRQRRSQWYARARHLIDGFALPIRSTGSMLSMRLRMSFAG